MRKGLTVKCKLSWQIWVKTAEVLARDRLLGSFSVSVIDNLILNRSSIFIHIS